MRVLVYSPPFSGHLNVLTKMMEEHKEHEYKLVITGWDNLPVKGATNLARSTLRETDPALWTFPRVSELMNDSLDVAKEYKPDLMVYDFFSLEGKFTSDLLGIPAWCSIPAMIGPNDKEEYLEGKLRQQRNVKALATLREKYRINLGGVEMVSEGLHLPGQVNLIWSFPELTPPNFMESRQEADYQFVGNYNTRMEREKDIVYFSLGTVVMDNLWNQQGETRNVIREYIARVAEGLKDENVVFVTQGKHILDSYPASWRIEDRVNQVEVLARSRAFITHGGSNSYHEAVLQRVPLVVVPFFGDQILVGQRTAELGIGINLGRDNSIDTKKSKSFLDRALADRTVAAVKEVLNNQDYQKKLDRLELTKISLSDVIERYFPEKI